MGGWPAAFTTIGKGKMIHTAYSLKDDTEHRIKTNIFFKRF
jgi:hypothetical protein